MKLVTGIEAIQSGKPWRHKDVLAWIYDDTPLGYLKPKDLREKMFIIKEEPREFWLDISKPSCIKMYPIDCQGIDFSREEFIKVREVEK